MVAIELSFEGCAVTVELSHNLVLALPGPSEPAGSWRFRLCRMDGDRLEIVDDHVHIATVMLLAGEGREQLAGAIASAIVLAAPGIHAHRLPAPLAPLVRELAEAKRVFELPERLCVDWDGSTVLFEVGLEQVFEQGDSGDGVIFEAEERYIQVLVNRERKVVYGEAVDPEHWQSGPPLTAEQRRRLAELGWSEPGRPFRSPNYGRLWTLGPHCSFEDIARVLATTMADIYRPTPGTKLESTMIYYGGRETGPEPRFLDAVEVDARYSELLRGGESLEGAVLRPERRYRYEDVNDLAELAAALLVAVNRRHALVDGNKRASITLGDEFLALNGYRLDGDDQELAALVWEVAAGLDEAETLERLRPFVVAGAPAEPFPDRYPAVIEALAR